MICGKVVAIIITFCGIIYGLTILIMLAKCIMAPKVPATIISYRGCGINSGIHTFTYRVFVAPDIVLQLEREVMPLMNFMPFYALDNYVGRNVMVSFDSKKKRLLPHEPILIAKLVLSLVVVALGVVMLIMLVKLQH